MGAVHKCLGVPAIDPIHEDILLAVALSVPVSGVHVGVFVTSFYTGLVGFDASLSQDQSSV